MKIYRGITANPMKLVTSCTSLRFHVVGKPDEYAERKYDVERPIKRLWGFSIGRLFFGFLWTEPASTTTNVVDINVK